MKDLKTAIKIASSIQRALMELQKQRYVELLNQLAKFVGQFKELGLESRKLGMSSTHNWLFAAKCCCNRTNRLLQDVLYSISRINQLTEEPPRKLAKLSFLVDDLNQLKQEFGNIDFDSKENTISVVTEPITLEGIYLGPFKIQLGIDKLSKLYRDSPYSVIALDPHPAATADEVTHPHVSNEKLCEGDGYTAIRSALEQGRLCDFFTMVRSILDTYNPDSPYVSLNDWDGEPCYECGYVMDSENSYYCQFCERSFCEECSTYCVSCDETVCLGCAGQCPQCGDMFCRDCGSECAECGKLFCKSCLEEDVCLNCKQEKENNENEEPENQITRTDENTNQNRSEADSSEVKLAG